MQSIYITNKNLEDKSLSILNDQLLRYPKIKLKKYTLDFFYSTGRESIYKKDQYFISNLGVFIYKNNFNKNALKLFMDDLLSGGNLKDLLLSKSTRGQFCLILYYQNQLKIITDRLGYYPMYFYHENDNVSFSNSMLLLSINNKTSLNHLGIAQL